MTTGQTILTLFEVVIGGFVIWAVFHEDIFVRLEDKIKQVVMKK